MGRFNWQCVRALTLGVTLVGVMASPAFAADPKTAAVAPSYTGTGIGVGSGGGSVDIGVPAGYAQLKQAQLAAMAAGKLPAQSVVRATKTGAGAANLSPAAQSTTSAGPMVATCNGTYPCVFSLLFPGFHQKTNYYCLVAFVQSVAFWDLSDSYRTMGTGTIRLGQDKIYNGYPGSPTIKSSIPPGASDILALAWINRQFSSYSGYTFYYVAVKPATVSSFMWYVRYDVDLYHEVNYVRIDLSTYAYRWGQSVDKYGNHPLHATAASGYDDNAGTVISYDPFAYGPNRVGGSCTSSSYSTAADWGCGWTITQGKYFTAMDRNTSLNDATAPVWY